uniref:Pectinesterase catalytic domain-containing protein n=1 Tax=Physcomitrium patens TaxID=3218 RepID=A0A2K1L250_PHYPA|nr:hypothetical protein PHYPA_002898 [Physcomitrium patens]
MSRALQLAQSSQKIPETREEVIASFASWIQRVGEKHDAWERAAKSAATADEFASMVGKTGIVVDQSGAGNFKTVNEALSSIPEHSKSPVFIKVNAGTYK